MPHPEPERREHAPPGTSLLAGLTPERAQAVTHGTGPLLLIAGPGAGKTRTPTHRIAHLHGADLRRLQLSPGQGRLRLGISTPAIPRTSPTSTSSQSNESRQSTIWPSMTSKRP